MANIAPIGLAEYTAAITMVEPVVIRKLDRMTEAYPDTYWIERIGTAYKGKPYCVSMKYIRLWKA